MCKISLARLEPRSQLFEFLGKHLGFLVVFLSLLLGGRDLLFQLDDFFGELMFNILELFLHGV